MPKVKLSALVSDMKGKSQGSVFASNSGGVYFRNNPSGGGKKSAKWGAQKNRFGSLSTRWKALTNEQRAAWSAAASMYPTLNAFGDERIPSGYELFMRLNGTLVSNNLSPIVLPQVKRPIPDIETIELITPDLFQFTPERQFKTFLDDTHFMYGYKPDFFINENFNQPFTFATRFQIPAGYPKASSDIEYAPIFVAADGVTYGTGLYYIPNNGAFGSFIVVYSTTTLTGQPITVQQYFKLQSALGNDSHHIGFRVLPDVLPSFELYLNGSIIMGDEIQYMEPETQLMPLVLAQDPVSPFSVNNLAFKEGTFYLGAPASATCIPFNFSDFVWLVANPDDPNCCTDPSLACAPDYSCESWWNDICECYSAGDPGSVSPNPVGAYTMALLRYGYVLGNERARIGLNRLTEPGKDAEGNAIPRSFINVSSFGDQYDLRIGIEPECTDDADCYDTGTGNDVECIDGVCTYVGDGIRPWGDIGNTWVPWTYFPGLSIEDENFFVQILCTGAISAGKSELQTRYIKVATIPLVNHVYNLTEALREAIVNLPGESSYSFKAKILDATTGVLYDMDIPVARPRNPRRFKAGAELSGKVN